MLCYYLQFLDHLLKVALCTAFCQDLEVISPLRKSVNNFPILTVVPDFFFFLLPENHFIPLNIALVTNSPRRSDIDLHLTKGKV